MNFSEDYPVMKTETPNPSQIRLLLNQLSDRLSNLDTDIMQLNEVLSPVISRSVGELRHGRPSEVQSDGGGLSPMAAELSQLVDVSRALSNKVRDLRDQIDL